VGQVPLGRLLRKKKPVLIIYIRKKRKRQAIAVNTQGSTSHENVLFHPGEPPSVADHRIVVSPKVRVVVPKNDYPGYLVLVQLHGESCEVVGPQPGDIVVYKGNLVPTMQTGQ
jgi:hypothetical protein